MKIPSRGSSSGVGVAVSRDDRGSRGDKENPWAPPVPRPAVETGLLGLMTRARSGVTKLRTRMSIIEARKSVIEKGLGIS